MKVVKIDENGFFVEDIIIDDNYVGVGAETIVFKAVTDGFIKPKWDGTDWVEGEDTEVLEQIEADKIQQEINISSRQYLKNTDWYIIRNIETGAETPIDILEKRAEARLKIVEIEESVEDV